MKKRYVILLLLVVFCWLSTTQWAKDFVKKDQEREAVKAKAAPPAPGNRLINTVWQSQKIGYSYTDYPDVVELGFYKDLTSIR